jgi:hypothetical protein
LFPAHFPSLRARLFAIPNAEHRVDLHFPHLAFSFWGLSGLAARALPDGGGSILFLDSFF